ncbi:MAG TPA: gas vesicle protein GvpJ [Gemmatimonadaceae bacterium]|nr:gas vesicle protein GvpJ [Gemmatimonadaceae bacterium]
MEPLDAEEHGSLVDVINGLLDRGVVVGGDVMLSVAGVDLVYLELRALLTAVSTAREALRGDRGAARAGSGAVRGGALPGGCGGGEGASAPAASPPRMTEPGVAPAPGPQSPAVGSTGATAHGAEATGGASTTDAMLEQVVRTLPQRVDIDPDAVQKDLARIVLVLVELLRRVVEHQALRRMDDGDLSDTQIERMGTALARLAEKMRELKELFGLADSDLDVDLGPLGHVL